jgi:adenosylcobinamide-phosphate synthase
MVTTAFILFVAHMLDRVLGDSAYSLHPVRLVGKGISALEKLLRKSGLSGIGGGSLLALFMILGTAVAYLSIRELLDGLHPYAGVLLDVYLTYSFLATGDLIAHARPIADCLIRHDLNESKVHIGKVVGRDVSSLSAHGVARAAIETLAENFVDGVLSPVFWFSAAGIVGSFIWDKSGQAAVLGIVFFKTVSTLDSMVGYKNKRYLKFGKISARLDDIMNFVPARISLIVLASAALLMRLPVKEGIRNFFRFRLSHLSPNSAHAESFMAGVLQLRLGGPSTYGGQLVQKPWIGAGSTEAAPQHILVSCQLVSRAADISVLLAIITMLAIS